jgi:hypothetical protein
MKQPAKWKFAIMVWLAIYPSITLVQMLLGDLLKNLPLTLELRQTNKKTHYENEKIRCININYNVIFL